MKLSNKIKALSKLSLISSALFLAACQNQINTISFIPAAPTASMNVNQSAVVYVNTQDVRSQPEIASYVKSGELIKLTAQPSVSQLFQQVMQQNLVSKGFRIGQTDNSNVGVMLEVNSFIANVDQGNLRYNINTKIQVTAYVRGVSGTYNKNFNATRSQSGAFNADNDEIKKVLTETFNDIVKNIYQDQEVTAAISQYSH